MLEAGQSKAPRVVHFADFELRVDEASLLQHGRKLKLQPQPFRLLAYLISRAPSIVNRDELGEHIWSEGVHVDLDQSLNYCIRQIRQVLDDDAMLPRYVETLPRQGYRFIAPIKSGTRPLTSVDDPKVPLAAPLQEPAIAAPNTVTGNPGLRRGMLIAAVLILAAAAAAIAFHSSSSVQRKLPTYTQITDFTDSATTPALSPDGHILAFIRGNNSFMSAGQIYVKMLPNGEARPLSKDPRIKYGLAFSPDGSQIAYTVLEDSNFATYTTSVLGGDPHLLLRNAAGLNWLDPQHYLFSKIRSGLHLGVVTESTTGEGYREVYYPPHERAMAHYSFASPDRRSALVVEMNSQGEWAGCKLISLAGTSPPRPVGPQGACTSAGWSPDGSWTYFVVTVEGHSHVWRQRYPDGTPEQITIGPAEEEGLVVEQNGQSIITSIGEYESSIWIHDAAGERPLSTEGEIVEDPSPPSFAEDDKVLYYLLRNQAGASTELWRLRLDTGDSEAAFPGTSMVAYDVSPDGKQVVYTTEADDGKSQLWIAPLDRSSAARRIGGSGETTPHFGLRGQIVFQLAEGNFNYLEQMNQDGSGRSKVLSYPILEVQGVSPKRRWLMALASYPESNGAVPRVVAIPLDGGPPRRICAGYCRPVWSSSGKFLFVPVQSLSPESAGRSLAVPVGPGEDLPQLPPGGIQPLAEPGVLPGAQSISRAQLVPGRDLSHYAYVKTTVHRNLYRISLP